MQVSLILKKHYRGNVSEERFVRDLPVVPRLGERVTINCSIPDPVHAHRVKKINFHGSVVFVEHIITANPFVEVTISNG